MAVIGIDLGTTYCAAAQLIDNKPEIIHLAGQPTMPSVAGVLPSGNIAVGWTAKRNQARNPQDTVVEVKRRMGKKDNIRLGQKEFSPESISAMFLREIKNEAEKQVGEITGAVITCPAYFKEPQREATKEAGMQAGLNVLRVLNEPTAAAAAYGITGGGDEDQENLFLVYDLGGGTFDVSVIEMMGESLDVIGTGGDPELGGGNFDDRIVDWMISRLEKIPGYGETLTADKRKVLRLRLKVYAEEAKIKLCGPPAVEEFQFQIPMVDKLNGKPISFTEKLTMDQFNEFISDLVENSFQWIDVAMEVPKTKKNYTEGHLTEILLVGGSTRVPLIRDMLAKRFPNTPIRGVESGINPDEVVASGAAIIAAGIDPNAEEIPDRDLILTDVTGHTLSVLVHDPQTNNPYLHPLIPKETPCPTKSVHHFSSFGEFATACRIKVYQGEYDSSKSFEDNPVTLVGEFEIEIDPIKEPTPLAIGLDLDDNQILVGHATNQLSGQQVKCELHYEGMKRISPEELKSKQEELEAQMREAVGRNVNPLEDAKGNHSPSQPSQSQPRSTSEATGATGDVRDVMNPIIRDLYDRTMSKFGSIPADRRMEVMRIVGELEQAAKANDQAKLMRLYDPLEKLLQGV